MKLLPVIAAAGVMAFTSSAPVMALSTGILQQSSNRVTLLVGERGNPVEVKIVAIDRQYNELDGVRTFPATFLAGPIARSVSASVPNETWAVCAKVVDPLQINQTGSGVIYKTCALVDRTRFRNNPNQLDFGSTRTGVRIQRLYQP